MVLLVYHPILYMPSCQNNNQLSVSVKNGSEDYCSNHQQKTAIETAMIGGGCGSCGQGNDQGNGLGDGRDGCKPTGWDFFVPAGTL
jgi:hypothetical protein